MTVSSSSLLVTMLNVAVPSENIGGRRERERESERESERQKERVRDRKRERDREKERERESVRVTERLIDRQRQRQTETEQCEIQSVDERGRLKKEGRKEIHK